jgi:hypothetical protein
VHAGTTAERTPSAQASAMPIAPARPTPVASLQWRVDVTQQPHLPKLPMTTWIKFYPSLSTILSKVQHIRYFQFWSLKIMDLP